MRGMNSLPLDDDIIDRIYFFLPEFDTLAALRSTSKAFNEVYKSHPNSIVRAICYNIVGPALPQAIRAIRHQPFTHPPLQPEDVLDETTPISPMSPDEIRQLKQNAEAVQYLEKMFSMMFKDRVSATSALNSMESWRFRRALYRLMLYSNIFPAEDILEREEGREEEEEDLDELREERKKRKKLLSSMNTFDLYEVHSVSKFMIELFRWVGNSDIMDLAGGSLDDLALARGPVALFEACDQFQPDVHEYRDLFADHDFEEPPSLLRGYISQPLQMIWEERKAKLPADDTSHWLSILDTLPNPSEACRRCNAVCGLNLYSEGSWNLLFGVSSACLRQIPAMLPGSLSFNVVDGPFFRSTLQGLREDENEPDLPQTKLLREIHELRTPPFDAWKKEDLLCEPCILEILRSHLHLWLLERKRKAGTVAHEDCWYGWNCRTQTHKQPHAGRLNHICAPTRN